MRVRAPLSELNLSYHSLAKTKAVQLLTPSFYACGANNTTFVYYPTL